MTGQLLPSPAKSSAAGQYLGYSLQQVRLCFHLLTAGDDDWVGLELLDDVSVHRPDGSVLLEQAKSALSGNPASTKAEDLWKTFANWFETCDEKNLSLTTTEFKYYVTPEKKSSLVVEMGKASTVAEAMIVLQKIKELAVAEAEPLPDWAKQIARFLKAGDHTCATIISRCEFVTEHDPTACIRKALTYLPEDMREDYQAAIIGLARDQIDTLIRSGKTRAIRAGTFRRAVWTFISRHNFANILRSNSTPPENAIVEALAASDPLFVRQLAVIEAPPTMMMMAVSDYLRTIADKVGWAESGIVLQDSFKEFDTQLQREHSVVCEEIDENGPRFSGPERGRRVYRLCRRTQMPLEGQNLPPYFIAGAFNCLAQDRRIGWHPDYLTLFPPE